MRPLVIMVIEMVETGSFRKFRSLLASRIPITVIAFKSISNIIAGFLAARKGGYVQSGDGGDQRCREKEGQQFRMALSSIDNALFEEKREQGGGSFGDNLLECHCALHGSRAADVFRGK